MPNTHHAFINVVKQCFNLESMSVTDDLKAVHIVQDIWEESDNPKKLEINSREYLSIPPFGYEGHARLRQMVIYMSEYMDKFSVTRLIGAPPGYVGFRQMSQGVLDENLMEEVMLKNIIKHTIQLSMRI